MNVFVVLLIPLAAVALVIRVLLFQPFDTVSTAMAPALVEGDQFFAAKFAYGYSRHSFPFSPPLFSGRVFGSQPAYGDIVVFRLEDGQTDYVERVAGLPGDRIQMRAGLLHINGQPVVREQLFSGDVGDACGADGSKSAKRWRETLPNGVSHETLDCIENGFYDNTLEYRVPAGHYFMMGDNRDNSTDSRVLSQVGYVPYENLIGRFVLIFSSGAGDE